MDSITLTINLNDLDACDGDFDQLVSDIQAFINILHHASPDYVEAGSILQKQLDEQIKKHKEESETPIDPVEVMRKHLDEMCPFDMETMQDADLKNLYTELRNQISGAPMAVTYAAYKLAKYIEEKNLGANVWVWDFVKYYEENWEVE